METGLILESMRDDWFFLVNHFPEHERVGGEFLNYHSFWVHKAQVKFNIITTEIFFSTPIPKENLPRQIFGVPLEMSWS